MAITPLNALNAFLEVARRRSFAAASRELGVSSSALSQSVKQLEERLGVPLLVRTSRSVALTDAGQRLLSNAGPAVEAALESMRTLTSQEGSVRGRLRLTAPTIAASLVLGSFLPKFAARHPGVEVEVRVENNFVNIVEQGLDAGIRLTEAIDRDMVQVRLTPPGRFVVAGAPSYFARRGVPQKVMDLLQHDCIGIRSTTDGQQYAWELERGKKVWRVPVRGPVTTNDSPLMHELALSGTGLIYAYEPLLTPHFEAGRLKVVLEAFAAPVPGFFLYFPDRSRISPALRTFVDEMREFAKSSEPKRPRSR